MHYELYHNYTIQRDKTHKPRSEKLVVQYPWHPLYGREVIVFAKLQKHQREVLRCKLENQWKSAFEIPQWMFDRIQCSLMRLTGRSHVSLSALVELRKLLDEGTAVYPLVARKSAHKFLQPKGGVDAKSNTIRSTGTVKSVSSSSKASSV